MMLIKIYRWLYGYLIIRVEGGSPERFVNLCKFHAVTLWNMWVEDKTYYFCISIKDFKGINDIAFKSRTYPRIYVRCGLPFYIKRILVEKTLLPCFILFIFTLYLMTSFVWDISITGNLRHTREEIEEYLGECGVKRGVLSNKLNLNKTEESIRTKFKDIGWVSASLKGCNIHVKLLESDVVQNDSNDASYFSHITASCDGRVDSIITRKGIPLVKKGDTVKKGDILIKGISEIKDDSGNIIARRPLFADGDVSIIANVDYKASFNLEYEKKIYTGKKQTDYILAWKNTRMELKNPLNKLESYKNYDIITENVCNGLISKIDRYEYDVIKCRYSENEALKKTENILNQYICDKNEENIKLINSDVKAKISDKECIASGKLTFKVLSLDRIPVTSEEWSVTKVYDGDGN